MGFKQWEYGMEWYASKDALMNAGPQPVLVSSSYVYSDPNGLTKNAMKFGSFASHWEYWETIRKYKQNEVMQNFHELIPASSPRCLYFDIDGAPEYRELHDDIIHWLRIYLRWVFSADKLGWDEQYPEPVVLTTENPGKYSCHVLFPQIQFANHDEQQLYMKVLLTALPKLEVELEGGMSIPILERVIDHVPYSAWQNFRGPYACKLKDGSLRAETQLRPSSGYFEGCELSCFASYVDADRALALPDVSELLEWNPELSHYYEQHKNRLRATGADGDCSMHDMSLYESSFQQKGGGLIDFAGVPDVEVYEEALNFLHPDRAIQWWSWFRICGVTSSMLEMYGRDAELRKRIWQAHHKWSSQYSHFTIAENTEMVEKGFGKRTSGLAFLKRLVRFDNPQMEVRTSGSKIFVPAKHDQVDMPSDDVAAENPCDMQSDLISVSTATSDVVSVAVPPAQPLWVPSMQPDSDRRSSAFL